MEDIKIDWKDFFFKKKIAFQWLLNLVQNFLPILNQEKYPPNTWHDLKLFFFFLFAVQFKIFELTCAEEDLELQQFLSDGHVSNTTRWFIKVCGANPFSFWKFLNATLVGSLPTSQVMEVFCVQTVPRIAWRKWRPPIRYFWSTIHWKKLRTTKKIKLKYYQCYHVTMK